jgi:hypothetical protein
VNGKPVSELASIPEGAWILRGDRGLTFARELPLGNKIVAGQWWPANYAGPPLISLDVDAAKALNLNVGDTLTVAVLGAPIEARIASLRTIDWRSFGFNFAIIFAPGTLEQAPYTLMATVAPDPGRSTLAFERALATQLPMVSTIRVSDVIGRVSAILGGLDAAISLATLVALLIGVAVLAGSVAATRRQRKRAPEVGRRHARRGVGGPGDRVRPDERKHRLPRILDRLVGCLGGRYPAVRACLSARLGSASRHPDRGHDRRCCHRSDRRLARAPDPPRRGASDCLIRAKPLARHGTFILAGPLSAVERKTAS